MKALIVAYAQGASSVTQALAHERAVRTNYLSEAVGTADIAVLFGPDEVINEPEVIVKLDGDSPGAGLLYPVGAYALRTWLESNPYDLVIFAYENTDGYIPTLSYIPQTLGIPLFMAMTNDAVVNQTMTGEEEIIFVGKGETSNECGYGTRITCYDDLSDHLANSTTTPIVAGKFSHLLDAGLTKTQAEIALFKGCDQYPTWDSTDGFGKVPATIPIPGDYTFTPPVRGGTPVTPPEVDPIPPVKPVLTAARTGTSVTASTDIAGPSYKLYRKLVEADPWMLITTSSTLTDTVDTKTNYIYAGSLTNGVDEGALSDPVYVKGDEVGGVGGFL